MSERSDNIRKGELIMSTCPQCATLVPLNASSCGSCGYGLAPTPDMSMTLRFPVEQPELRALPLDQLPPAAAPTLMPGPPPPKPRLEPKKPQQKKTMMTVGAILFVIATVVVIATVSASHGNKSVASNGPGQVDNATGVIDTGAGPTTTTPSNSAPSTERSAKQMLDNEVANDRSQVDALTEHWVPQLSSKRVGLKVDATTYDYRAIWADFTSLRAQYPSALLLRTDDYSSYHYKNFWVTIAAQPYSTGEAANDWCTSAGIGKDDCYAKRISHTTGYTHSTLPRS
jgi:serine/threonine-protein kinase